MITIKDDRKGRPPAFAVATALPVAARAAAAVEAGHLRADQAARAYGIAPATLELWRRAVATAGLPRRRGRPRALA